MARDLGRQLRRAFREESIRQTLHRAREKFADLLLDEVERSIHDGAPGGLEQELVDLGLLEYCRPALKRRLRQGDGDR
jgi:hypothetical protein